MSNATIIFLLTLCIMILICIIVYQQFVFHNGTKAKIHEISSKLKELLDTDSDEKVTVFTDNKALIELATQINRMLEDRQKVKVEYRRAEMASKKMLSNISHDIKTPMTVILGYLEIMRLNGTQSNEMLQKVESTAQRVMGLITQFFTLAKLEAGDTKPAGKIFWISMNSFHKKILKWKLTYPIMCCMQMPIKMRCKELCSI